MSAVQGGNGSNTQLARQAPVVEREGFGTTELAPVVETAATALAAQAKAEVEAAYVVAMRRPRDLDTARDELLKAARRPSFAETAIYKLPRGGKSIEGPTIRFAEEALRCYRNVRVTSTVSYDDPIKRKILVRVYDLESLVLVEAEVMLEKTVERREPKAGEEVLGQRINSFGKPVFLVAATDAELLQKQLAETAKARRNLLFQIVPGWLVAEAKAEVYRTLAAEIQRDPDAARRALLDTFSSRGIRPADVKEYLGHDPASCSPAELDELRGLLTSIQDGEITWPDALSAKTGTRTAEAGEQKTEATATVEKLRAKGAAAKAEQAKKAADAKGPRQVKGASKITIEDDDPAASDPAMAEGVDVGEIEEPGSEG